jgi:hypothetical protein
MLSEGVVWQYACGSWHASGWCAENRLRENEQELLTAFAVRITLFVPR